MFSAFSALCGMAGDLNSMIFYRILQAIPGGVIPVTCLTILYKMVPREKIGAAMGLYGLGIVVAPGVGPTLGGYLVEYVDWRLIFYINVPVGILGAIAAMAILPRFPGVAGRHFDLPGFVCIAVALFSLLLASSEGTTWGWTGYRVLMLVALSVSALALFVVIELQSKEPLLNVRVFRHWPYVNSLILVSVISIGLFAVLFYVPNFLQEGQHLTPFNTGLVLFPQAMVTRPELIGWMCIRAAGIGLAMMPIMTGGLSVLPASLTSAGSAFNTIAQRVSSALGLALLTAMSTAQQAQFMADRSSLLQSQGPAIDPRIFEMQQQGPTGLISLWQELQTEVSAQTYSNIFLVSGLLTLAAIGLAIFLRNAKAAGGGEPVEIG
jgi:MFS family permease